MLFWRYTFASILHFYANVTVGGDDANPGRRAFRMAMNIRETLLHGPEKRSLTLGPVGVVGELAMFHQQRDYSRLLDNQSGYDHMLGRAAAP